MILNPARWPVGTAFCSLAMVISAMARAQQAAAVLGADADTTVNEEVAPDQASRQDDSTPSSDTAQSSLPATQPSGAPGQQIQDNMQQTQNPSQERTPETQRNQPPTQQIPGSTTPDEATVPETPPPAHATEHMRWLDRTHQGLHDAMWHAAMRVDRWFGPDVDEEQYKSLYGSIAYAVLWDQHYHFKTPLRFNVNWPLPQINERFNAFIGRVDPNEFISERDEPSGAFRRQYGPITEDQTLFGLSYHEPEKQGGYFTGGAGMRVATPLDPYLKGSYVYEHGASERGLVGLRETVFWQHSDGFGVAMRADIERIYNLHWLVRWTGSATFAQHSLGVRGWSAVDVMRGFSSRRAVAAEIEIDGQTNAPVPLRNYGMKLAYRKGILRRWLIMEARTSIGWPKDQPGQRRRRSLGLGLGFEMLFGTTDFLARPVTF